MTNADPEPSNKSRTVAGGLRKTTGQQGKENAMNKQRTEILDWYHRNRKNQSLTARHFNEIYPSPHIKQPLISSWVKDEAEWHAAYALDGTFGLVTGRIGV